MSTAETSPPSTPEDAASSGAALAADLQAESKAYFEARTKLATEASGEKLAAYEEERRAARSETTARPTAERRGVLSNSKEAEAARTKIAAIWADVPDEAYGPVVDQGNQREDAHQKLKNGQPKSSRKTFMSSAARISAHLRPRKPSWLRGRS